MDEVIVAHSYGSILYSNEQIIAKSKNMGEVHKHNVEGIWGFLFCFVFRAGTTVFLLWDSTYVKSNIRPN